jgi:hypothetical protein
MRFVTAITVMVLLASACGYDNSGVTYPPDGPATITLSAPSTDPFTSAGETRSVTAVVKDATGATIVAPSLSWRSSTPGVATVAPSADGATVTAVDDGTAVVTAASGTAEATLTVTVRRRLAAIEVSAPDSIVAAGATTQLTVVGRDARQQEIRGLTGVTFASSSPLSVLVSPSGLVTALFSPFYPTRSTVTATIVRDGVTLSATTPIAIGNPAPSVFDLAALMFPEAVRPEPVLGLGQGVIYLTVDGTRVQYKMLWSLLSGPAVSAHVHGPDGTDGVAPVLVELALGTQTATNGVLTGSFSAVDIRGHDGRPPISLDSLVTLMRTASVSYADIHTARFGDGELRGQLAPVR